MSVANQAAPRTQLNKKIWDWRDLESAVTSGVRLGKQNDLSTSVLNRALMHGSRVAQLDDRVCAIGGRDCIALTYGHTAPGAGLESLSLLRHVRVFPAQGGRTTYEISSHANGWFANKWLPINARDRGNRSVHRQAKWYYGQSGVYSKGCGPLYPDVGPACCNTTLDQVKSLVESSVRVAEETKDRVVSFLTRLSEALAPFGDAIVRYSWVAIDRDVPDRDDLVGHSVNVDSYLAGFRYQTRCEWTVTASIKHPAVATDSGWACVPDYDVTICGPSLAHECPDDLSYVASTTYAGGFTGIRDTTTRARWCATTNGKSAIDAARAWCADHLYIPA